MATKVPKNSFTKAFTKTKLGYLLDKEINKGEFEWEYKFQTKSGDVAWHPSSHCIQTPKELYYIAKGELELFEGTPPYKTFQVGHFWHQYLQEICIRSGFCEKRNVERNGVRGWGEMGRASDWEPYHWVTGSADIAPCEIPGQGLYLVDFKTCGKHNFVNTAQSTLLKWEAQLNIYMDFFDLEKSLIVKIEKDHPHAFGEVEFTRNQPLIDALYEKWEFVGECLDSETPPGDEDFELPFKGVNE